MKISGTQIYSTLFLIASLKSGSEVKIFEKVNSLVIALLHNLFLWFCKIEQKKKYLWRGYKDCDKNNIYAWQKKKHQKQPKLQLR